MIAGLPNNERTPVITVKGATISVQVRVLSLWVSPLYYVNLEL
jgi:hypothetical protein